MPATLVAQVEHDHRRRLWLVVVILIISTALSGVTMWWLRGVAVDEASNARVSSAEARASRAEAAIRDAQAVSLADKVTKACADPTTPEHAALVTVGACQEAKAVQDAPPVTHETRIIDATRSQVISAVADYCRPLGGCIGPAGGQGPPGESVIGTKGDKGDKGDAGAQGPTGAAGAAGADSTTPGPVGPVGPAGADGQPGKDGAPGTPAPTITGVTCTRDSGPDFTLTVTLSDGTSYAVTCG